MTPDRSEPTPDTRPDPTAPTRPEWGDDPPPFTAEEIEDLRANGVSLDDLIAELESRGG